ncbi:hypothetical protein DPMN_129497 [Dreissena polymorpha]|uniref:Uncharacterized protein n=1 Tax=Dreissena polymorpha TaxID=45954 RepID=A0A9D4H2W0_DREPO|nr:hypothetical protein DPMN_129497 [Dreissena polymorpha]
MHRRFKYAWAIAVLVVLPDIVISASAPSGCTGSDDGWFSCDYAGMTQAADRPIDFADFSPAPLALNVYVNGLLPPIGKPHFENVEIL